MMGSIYAYTPLQVLLHDYLQAVWWSVQHISVSFHLSTWEGTDIVALTGLNTWYQGSGKHFHIQLNRLIGTFIHISWHLAQSFTRGSSLGSLNEFNL